MKIKTVSGKTWAVNHQLFIELCCSDEKFLQRLSELRAIIQQPRISKIYTALAILGGNPTNTDWSKLENLIRTSLNYRKQFNEDYSIEVRRSFLELIDQMMTDSSLGPEWKYPLIDLVFSGLMIPPIANMTLTTRVNNISLVLNGNTTYQDVKVLWNSISKYLIKISVNTKKRHFRPKFSNHVELLAKSIKIKKKSSKITSLELVGRISPNPNDQEELPTIQNDIRAANNLRQIQHRFKKL